MVKKRLPRKGDLYEVAYAPALKVKVLKVRRTWVERSEHARPAKVVWVAFQSASLEVRGSVAVLDLERFRAEYCFVRHAQPEIKTTSVATWDLATEANRGASR